MEEQLRANCELLLNQTTTNNSENTPSLVALSSARSLIINPSTSEPTISSILETLARSLQLYRHHHHTLSLLSDLALHRPHLSPAIFTTIHSSLLSQLESASTRAIAQALSVLVTIAESDQTLTLAPSIRELSEGLFASLCFRPCVSVRHWLLLNAERLNVAPHVLITLFLGFTKDPYPNVRRVALDGLVGLCKSVRVEDHGLIQGCYCRAVELLSDMEDCVRSSAVSAVSAWGQLLVASCHDKNKRDWSDVLFLQLCSMVRDMSLEVRVKVFDALGLIEMVSENILLQTLSKKVLAIAKENKDLRQYSVKLFKLPLSHAAGAFIHGLEDEFYEVRRSACHSLRMLTVLSADFAGEALNILVDVLNDDSLVVRAEVLETMHRMAMFNLLKVQETHMPMFLGTLFDNNASVRSAVRRILRSMKLRDMAIFKLAVFGLLENLEMYPQDEADVFSVLFSIGRHHGSFSVSIIEEISDEIEPSCKGKLGFDSARVAALLVLAISVPLSSDQHMCSVPPKLFSYAVTLLGRISRALRDVVPRSSLLAYLSDCSRCKDVSAAEFNFKEEEPFLRLVDGSVSSNTDGEIVSPAGIHLQQSWKSLKPRNLATSPLDHQFENNEVTKSLKVIFSKVKDLWQLMQIGCTDVVLKTLRCWKEELATSTTEPFASTVAFTLQYLKFMKQLVRIWVHFVFPRNRCSHGVGKLSLVFAKLDRSLREMKCRFIGLSKEEELHVLELSLLNCALRLSTAEACCNGTALKKLYSTMSQVESLLGEGSVEPSNFVIELKKSLFEFDTATNGSSHSPLLFQKLAGFFSLKQFVLCGKFNHIKAELNIHDNDLENPFPFVSGLPVGIPLEITLYNISSKDRLWLKMTVYEELTEFNFLDLDQFGDCDNIRKCTYVAPFYRTPKVSSFPLRVCVGLECSSEDDVSLFNGPGGPKHEFMYLCKEKEVYLSGSVKK